MTSVMTSASSSAVTVRISAVTPIPRYSTLLAIWLWSAPIGKMTIGTPWYIASYKPLLPPWYTKARVFSWPLTVREENLKFIYRRIWRKIILNRLQIYSGGTLFSLRNWLPLSWIKFYFDVKGKSLNKFRWWLHLRCQGQFFLIKCVT